LPVMGMEWEEVEVFKPKEENYATRDKNKR